MAKRPGESGNARAAMPILVVAGLAVAVMALTYLARKGAPEGPDEPDGGAATGRGDGGEKDPAGGGKASPEEPPKPEPLPAVHLAGLFGDKTLALVWCKDIPTALAHGKQTPLFAIGSDPEVKSFIADIGRRNPKQRKEYDDALPIGRLLSRVFRSGAALAVLDVEPETEVVHAVMVGELAEGDESVALLMDLLRPEFEAEGTIQQNAYGGESYEALSIPGQGVELCWKRLPGHMVAATTERALRAYIDRAKLKAPADTLGASEGFRATAKRLGPGPDIAAYINVGRLIEKLATTPEDRLAARRLGLADVKSIGVASRMGPNGIIDRIIIMAPPKRTGLLALLDPKAARPKCPSIFPSSSAVVASLQVDPKRIWKELHGPLADAGITDRASMDELADGIREKTGMRLEEDVLEAFGGEVAVAVTLTPIGAQPNFALVIETTDAKKAARFADGLISVLCERGAEKDSMVIGETEVHFLKATGNPFVPSPSYALRGRHLIVTASTYAMREMLRAPTAGTLASNDAFRRFGQIVPAGRPGVLFLDIPRLAAVGYDQLQMQLLKYKGLFIDFDAAKLPTAGLLHSHLSPGGLSLTQDDEAIRIDVATPVGAAGIVGVGIAADYILTKMKAAKPASRSGPDRLNPWPRRGTRGGP